MAQTQDGPLLGAYSTLPDGPAETKAASSGTVVAVTASASGFAASPPPPAAGPPAVSPATALQSALEQPGVLEAWDGAYTLSAVLLGGSLASLVVGSAVSPFAMAAAICCLGASLLYFYVTTYGPAGGRWDLASASKTIQLSTLVGAALSAVLSLFLLFLAVAMSHACSEDEEHHDWGREEDESHYGGAWCEQITEALFFCFVWFGAFTALAAVVSRRFERIRRLANPVSAGVYAV